MWALARFKRFLLSPRFFCLSLLSKKVHFVSIWAIWGDREKIIINTPERLQPVYRDRHFVQKLLDLGTFSLSSWHSYVFLVYSLIIQYISQFYLSTSLLFCLLVFHYIPFYPKSYRTYSNWICSTVILLVAFAPNFIPCCLVRLHQSFLLYFFTDWLLDIFQWRLALRVSCWNLLWVLRALPKW